MISKITSGRELSEWNKSEVLTSTQSTTAATGAGIFVRGSLFQAKQMEHSNAAFRALKSKELLIVLDQSGYSVFQLADGEVVMPLEIAPIADVGLENCAKSSRAWRSQRQKLSSSVLSHRSAKSSPGSTGFSMRGFEERT